MTTRFIPLMLGLALTTVALADAPLPEPDLTYYGSVTVGGTLLEVEDPLEKIRVRAVTMEGVTLDTYRMFSNADAEVGGTPQYLVRVPMEFVPVSALPSDDAVRLGDAFELLVESCPFDCDEAGATWTLESTTDVAVRGRGTVTVLDLPGGTPCLGDINGDGEVGFPDILQVLSNWGSSNPDADLDGNGEVGFSDLLIVLSNSGPCPP